MSYRRNFIFMMILILGLIVFVPVSQAERLEYEAVSCYSGTHTPVQFSPTGEIYAGGFEAKGIMRRTTKPYLEATFHQVGVMKGQGTKYSWNGLAKYMYSDGDIVVWEYSGDTESGQTIAKLIYGTGKYKGAKGESKTKSITRAKPIVPGTEQACNQVIGWMELAQ